MATCLVCRKLILRCPAYSNTNQLVAESPLGLFWKLEGLSADLEGDVSPSKSSCRIDVLPLLDIRRTVVQWKHFRVNFLSSKPKIYFFWLLHLCCMDRAKSHVFKDKWVADFEEPFPREFILGYNEKPTSFGQTGVPEMKPLFLLVTP